MNEQLSGHGPRGSHHGVKRSLPPNWVMSAGRIRAQWSFKITLARTPGPSASVTHRETARRGRRSACAGAARSACRRSRRKPARRGARSATVAALRSHAKPASTIMTWWDRRTAAISRSSGGHTAKMTPTTMAIESAMASPVRSSRSLPRAGPAAGEQPINEAAGDAGGGQHLALARQKLSGSPT